MTAQFPIDSFFEAYGCVERAHDEVAASLASKGVDAEKFQELSDAVEQYAQAVVALEEHQRGARRPVLLRLVR